MDSQFKLAASTRAAAAVALIFAAALLAYLPAYSAEWCWDDDLCIYKNTAVTGSDGLARIWFRADSADFWPLTTTVFWLEYRLFGLNPAGYHAVNIALHALGAALTYMVLRRLKVPGALAAGLIFAVHPMAVPSVAWVSEHKNTLSFVFLALSVLSYLRADEGRGPAWYVLSVAAYALALASKTSVAMLPVGLLGLAWWRRGKVTGRDVLLSLPFLLLSAAMAWMTILVQWRHPDSLVTPLEGIYHVAGAGFVFWFCLYKSLLPVGLNMIYPHWKQAIESAGWVAFLPTAALLALAAFLWMKRRTWWGRASLVALGYLVLAMFPVMGFFKMSYMMHSLVSDHLLYLPLAGVVIFACAACRTLASRLHARHLSAATAAVVIVLTALTVRRAELFQTQESLWRDTVDRNPDAWMAHYNLANELIRKARDNADRLREAEAHYRRAIDIQPMFVRAYNNLGCALTDSGRKEAGIKVLQSGTGVEALKPAEERSITIYLNLEQALREVHRFAEARDAAEEALRLAVLQDDAESVRKIRDHLAARDAASRENQPER